MKSLPDGLKSLCTALGHSFAKPRLLEEALTHPSAGRKAKHLSYERLEFLGDRVLGLVIADMLLRTYPTDSEGDLARRHAALVKRETLVRVAESIGLGEHVLVSKAEGDSGGRANPALLADSCEAILGAMYSDGGLDAAAQFIRRAWTPLMAEAASPPKDAKTAVQEWAQGLGKTLPVYETVAMEGPAHDPHFHVVVRVEGMAPAEGRGASKRAAEQAAAAALLAEISR